MDSVTGTKVSLTTTFGESVTGTIYNFDPVTKCVTLSCHAEPPKRTYRVINVDFVQDVKVLEVPTTEQHISLPPVNIERIKQFEAENLTKIGVGVPEEAQALFNALSKIYPCKWDGKTIVVMEEVFVKPPYTGDSCSGKRENSVARVKKVVEGERSKLKR